MQRLRADVQTMGKPAWREMLLYVAGQHEVSSYPLCPPFPCKPHTA
jgi:hypothetical protein